LETFLCLSFFFFHSHFFPSSFFLIFLFCHIDLSSLIYHFFTLQLDDTLVIFLWPSPLSYPATGERLWPLTIRMLMAKSFG
jgi:hypothetical protein